MSADICELFNDGHFLFKIADAAAAFYGTKNLFEFQGFKNSFHAAAVSLAFPGSLISMAILIYLYRIQKKDDLVEDIFLKVYGLMNVLAAYFCFIRRKQYMGCPVSMFNNINCMMVSGVVGAVCMWGEKFYYLAAGSGGSGGGGGYGGGAGGGAGGGKDSSEDTE